ncbi:MAG: GNAT family N-acetyltransferase [Planctomycetota bacterium]
MSSFPPFAPRPLDPSGQSEALAIAAEAGLHGVYLQNDLRAGQGETLALWGRDEMLGCAWFGPRGNMVLVERVPLDPVAVADAVHMARWPWRIALGPAASIDAISKRLSGPPLVLRDQVYYGAEPSGAPSLPAAESARPAVRSDRDRLMAAALELNRSDLNVAPERVDRRWLRESVTSRIVDGTSLVLGPPGGFSCKLDLGSRGPAGEVIEGVYTFPDARGKGHAAALVAAATSRSKGPIVCLHVSATNLPARRAYERAGLRPQQSCRLLLCS